MRVLARGRDTAATAGNTMGAAKALLRDAELGSLEPGKLADIQIWDLPSFEDVIYRLDQNPVVSVIKRGQVRFETKGL